MKSVISKAAEKELILRDTELLETISYRRSVNRIKVGRAGTAWEPLLVYRDLGDGSFPVSKTRLGTKIPLWRDVSEWMRLHIGLWAMAEVRCLAFTINLHPEYEAELVRRRPRVDIRVLIRDNLRRELQKVLGESPPEFLMVIEGRTTQGRPTYLHIHGGVMVEDSSLDVAVRHALKRACGHHVGGRGTTPAASRLEEVYGLEHKYTAYSQKNILKHDDRLARKRVAMSQPLRAAGKLLWEFITTGRGAVT